MKRGRSEGGIIETAALILVEKILHFLFIFQGKSSLQLFFLFVVIFEKILIEVRSSVHTVVVLRKCTTYLL